MHDDFRDQLYTLLASPAFQQTAPLIVLVVVPTLVLALNSYRHSIATAVLMVFDSLALIFPWNWSDNSSTPNGSLERRKLRRKQQTRSRDEDVSRTPSQVRPTMGTIPAWSTYLEHIVS
ncbi:hypothetical protein C8Q80DRAFT_300981 [Daedaleopsis nitida]|nr:hypothetical protein C8Q80DRAFT_300981 [Daedaleopsis nitida]